MKNLLVGSIALLAACAGPGGPSPKDTVLGMESALTAVDGIALNYTSLPRCPAAKACSDATSVAAIKGYAQTAHDSIVVAQAAVDADPKGTAAATAAALATAAADLATMQTKVSVLTKAN